MRVWLIQIGEVLPIDPGTPKLIRTSLLAQALHARGHDVTYWASTFEYRERRHRATHSRSQLVQDGYRVQLLYGGDFKRSISFDRIRYHARLSREFERLARSEAPPDLIVAGYPTIDLASAAAAYGAKHNVPVILDVRDLWPDIFVRAMPKALRPLARLGIRPMRRTARRALAAATGICSITPEILSWALARAGRTKSSFDADFPHGYAAPMLSPERRADALARWAERGINPEASDFLVCYLGGFHATMDPDTVFAAADLLAKSHPRIRFVFCGQGIHESRMRSMAATRSNVAVPGWIGADDIWTLMEMSAVGLLSYHSVFDFEASIPNKPIEYMAGGLPIASSLERGILRDLITEHGCGVTYSVGRPDQLAYALVQLHDDPVRRIQMAAAARRLYETRFEAGRVYEAMASHLEDVVVQHRAARGLTELVTAR